MNFNIEFVLPSGKGRLPSRLFFSSLYRMGVDIDKYLVPTNWELTPQDMQLYCDSILFDLLTYVKSGGAKNDDYRYVREIVEILKSWANKGYQIKVL